MQFGSVTFLIERFQSLNLFINSMLNLQTFDSWIVVLSPSSVTHGWFSSILSFVVFIGGSLWTQNPCFAKMLFPTIQKKPKCSHLFKPSIRNNFLEDFSFTPVSSVFNKRIFGTWKIKFNPFYPLLCEPIKDHGSNINYWWKV